MRLFINRSTFDHQNIRAVVFSQSVNRLRRHFVQKRLVGKSAEVRHRFIRRTRQEQFVVGDVHIARAEKSQKFRGRTRIADRVQLCAIGDVGETGRLQLGYEIARVAAVGNRSGVEMFESTA